MRADSYRRTVMSCDAGRRRCRWRRVCRGGAGQPQGQCRARGEYRARRRQAEAPGSDPRTHRGNRGRRAGGLVGGRCVGPRTAQYRRWCSAGFKRLQLGCVARRGLLDRRAHLAPPKRRPVRRCHGTVDGRGQRDRHGGRGHRTGRAGARASGIRSVCRRLRALGPAARPAAPPARLGRMARSCRSRRRNGAAPGAPPVTRKLAQRDRRRGRARGRDRRQRRNGTSRFGPREPFRRRLMVLASN